MTEVAFAPCCLGIDRFLSTSGHIRVSSTLFRGRKESPLVHGHLYVRKLSFLLDHIFFFALLVFRFLFIYVDVSATRDRSDRL